MTGTDEAMPPLVARRLAAIKESSIAIGRRTIVPLNDGEFVMARDFLNDPRPHDELADSSGVVRMPLGCFLLPGDPVVLIDTGFGPRESAPLRGGLLLAELAAVGVRPADIDIVAISHLHRDHRGWLATLVGTPVFEHAQVFLGAADWRFFIEERARPVEENEQVVLEQLYNSGRLVLLDAENELAPGVIALPAPGHTPGHTVFAVVDGRERALLLGDSMYCPQQLTELDWAAVVDTDPALARRTREALHRDLEAHDALAVGCHFPNLRAARLLNSPETA